MDFSHSISAPEFQSPHRWPLPLPRRLDITHRPGPSLSRSSAVAHQALLTCPSRTCTIFIMWVVARPWATPDLGLLKVGDSGYGLCDVGNGLPSTNPTHHSESKGEVMGVGWLNGGFWQLGAGRRQRSGGEWPSSCCNCWSVAQWLLYWRLSVWGETKLGWIGCTTTAIEPTEPTIEPIPVTVADSSSDNGHDHELH